MPNRSSLIGFAAIVAACGGSVAPREDTVAVVPLGTYALVDSVVGGNATRATGSISIDHDSTYVWSMGSTRHAGYWHGPIGEIVIIDTTSRGFFGVWYGKATRSRLTIRTLNETVNYRFIPGR